MGDTGIEPVTSCVSCIDDRPAPTFDSDPETQLSSRQNRDDTRHIGAHPDTSPADGLQNDRANWRGDFQPALKAGRTVDADGGLVNPDGRRVYNSATRLTAFRTYIAWFPELNRIKIGKATNIKTRMKALRQTCPGELHLVAVIESDREAELHHQFRHAHVIREWFHAYPSLVAFIHELNPAAGITPMDVDEKVMLRAQAKAQRKAGIGRKTVIIRRSHVRIAEAHQ